MSVSESWPDAVAPALESTVRLRALQDQVAHMASYSPAGELQVPDEFQRNYFASLGEHLGNTDFPAFNQFVTEDLKRHPDRLPINIANLYLRDAQDAILRTEWPHSKYPYGYDRPEPWDYSFVTFEASETEQHHYRKNSELNVQTNLPDRIGLIKAAALAHGRTTPQSLIDIGWGRGHGAKKLASERAKFPYGHTTIVRPGEDDHTSFNRLLNKVALPVRQIVGIDIQDMLVDDPDEAHKLKQWGRHCFYPSEYMGDRQRVYDYALFEDMHLPHVNFFRGDITDFDHDRYEHTFQDEPKADIAYFSTVGYQLGEEGMRHALANAKQLVAEDGLIMILDFVDISPDGTMEFFTDWPKWSYGLYVLDLAREEDGFQKYFSADSGRVRRVKVEPAAARVALKHNFVL